MPQPKVSIKLPDDLTPLQRRCREITASIRTLSVLREEAYELIEAIKKVKANESKKHAKQVANGAK
jgi:type II secretory pathway component PulF